MSTSSDIDYRRLLRLYEEFDKFWHQMHGLYLDAIVGFATMRANVELQQARARALVQGSELDSEKFQDGRLFHYTDHFVEDFCASAIHRAKQGDVKRRNTPGGDNFAMLSRLCVTAFYDYWEDYLRRELVVARGLLDRNEVDKDKIESSLRQHAQYDLWGDLRHLRTSIVHNRGIATSDVERCKLIKVFRPGDSVSFNPEQMRALFLALLSFRNALHKMSLPPSTTQFVMPYQPSKSSE